MKVNPLMTVWLISCAITYSGLTVANRYSSFKYEKKSRGASELARLYGRGDSLASYKLNALRLLAVEKKKKNKSSDTKTTTTRVTTDFDACESPSSTSSTKAKNKKGGKTTAEADANSSTEDPCAPSSTSRSTTSKNKKGGKTTAEADANSSTEDPCAPSSTSRSTTSKNKKGGKTTAEAEDNCTTEDPCAPSSTTSKNKKGGKNSAEAEDNCTTEDPCAPSSTTNNKNGCMTTAEAEDNCTTEDLCATSSSTTTKSKKGAKKTKTSSTTSSQGGDGGDINIINASGGNKWKKIQKFFFGPPNWSFNKSYRIYGSTTNEAKYKEELTPVQLHQRPTEGNHDQTTIRDSNYLQSIPNITNDQYKDKLFVKEEITKKNTPGMENNYPKGQINDVGTSNNSSKQQPNEIEKSPPRKFYENDAVSKEPISQEGRFITRNQEDGYDRTSSLVLADKTDEIKPSMQTDQQEAILSIPWYLKQEESTFREKLSESDKMSSIGEGKLITQEQQNEPEKEPTGTEQNDNTNRVIYNNEYIPSVNRMEPIENINYNTKGTLYTDSFETANTIGIDEDIDERQLQLKPEEITENLKEKYEVSNVREDPKLSFKPEATIELERPPNQTSMENPDLSYKQNHGKTVNNWKHIFNFNDPDYEQLKNLYNSIMQHRVTDNDIITSKIENTFDKIIKSNFNKIYNIDNESNNMTDSSNMFLKTFGNLLRKGIPENFPHHTAENFYKTSLPPIYDVYKDNAYDQREKQFFFVNTETRLPVDQIKNNSTVIQVDEEKYLPLTTETTPIGKPTSDYLQALEQRLWLKDEPLLKKPNTSTSTAPSSTIMKQYSIDMWPKYTEKVEYNVDYFNNINTQSSVQPSDSTVLIEVSSSSNHPNELSLTETTNASESIESLQEAGKFESVVTIPLIFTDKDSEIKNSLAINELSTTKQVGSQVLNLTLDPVLFSNILGYLNYSSHKPTSSTFNTSPDDQSAFDNQHEFNDDNYLQSTTSQPFFSNTTTSEWAPFNIPVLENDPDIISSSTLKINQVAEENLKSIKQFPNINELVVNGMLKKKEMSMIEKNNKSNFTFLPKYIPFSGEINRRNFFLSKPESVKKIHKYISHQKELLNDPTWGEIMRQARLRNQKIGYPIQKFRQSEKLFDGNQIYQNFRKPSFFEEKIRDDNLINFPPFSKGKVTNNGRDHMTELLVEPFLRNLKMGGRNYDNNEVVKNGIDKIATEVTNDDQKMKNELNFWSNLNALSSFETEQIKEITNKYEQTIAVDDEFNQNATSWPLLEFQRKYVSKVNGDKFDSLSIHNNEMLTKEPSVSLLNEKKAVTSSSGRNIHNEQNEKILASEKNFDKKLSISSAAPVNLQNEINSKPLKDNNNFLNNIMNQSLPEITKNSDPNKNEFSAIHMSAIKIFKKKPEMSVPSLYDPFKNIFDQNSNNTGINYEMSQMFMKMQDLANKFGMKKILFKRGVTDPQNNPIVSYCSWRYKCSTLPSCKTETVPFFSNLTNNNIQISPLTFIRDKKCSEFITNVGDKISNKWKYNIQSVIDKQNEKRNIDLNTYKDNIQENRKLNFNIIPLEISSGNLRHQSLINSDDNYGNDDEHFFTDSSNKGLKRNVLGNKKMKSRELEFILDKNLPRLPLNKRQFIAYMTGLKNLGDHIALDEEKRSQLSKANLQNLIDRNVKKEKAVELTNKRPRKKQWNTKNFP